MESVLRAAGRRREAAPRPPRGGGSWRRRAWELMRSGRYRAALDLQRALVTSRRPGSPRAALRDRFRLLRWQLAAGEWRGAIASVERIYARLARRGIMGGPVVAWLYLARATAQFQLGETRRYRRSLAAVLRYARRGRSPALRAAALSLAAAGGRLARDPARAPSVAQLRAERRAARAPLPAGCRGEGQLAGPAAVLTALEAALSDPTPATLSRTRRFGWRSLPAGVSGPPALPLLSPVEWSRLLDRWTDSTTRRPRSLPGWFLPWLARAAEEEAPEARPERRAALYLALSSAAASVQEPWARAAALESLAEVVLWLAADTPPPGTPEPAALMAQARADLGLAAGLFRRLGWEERAAANEERWARLALPAFGPRVGEAFSPPLEAETAPGVRREAAPGRPAPPGGAGGPAFTRRPDLRHVRQALLEAGFITGDRKMLQELAALLLLAPSPLPVLLLGESGTGKEVLARAIHRWSRLRGEFVPIHCGAIPRDLLESELFGHKRGAFTGASGEKPGLIEAADGGTLLLDEIGEMGMEAQMKMLRVLESGEVRRLGDLHSRRTSVRLVAATHRDLGAEIDAGRFRLDLFHRIRGVVVRLRPLRERRGDIPLLAGRWLAPPGGNGGPPLRLSPEALCRLLAYDWPGNVRELRAALLRAGHLAGALGWREIPAELLALGAGPEGSPVWTERLWTAPQADPSTPDLDPPQAGAPGGAAGVAEEGGAGEPGADPGGSSAGMDRGTGAAPCVGSGAGRSGRERFADGGAESAAGVSWRWDDPLGALPAAPEAPLATLPAEGLDAFLERVERRIILSALRGAGWNRTHAARNLGDMSRTTLLSKMKRLGIEGDAPLELEAGPP